jgi:hypothetical protein
MAEARTGKDHTTTLFGMFIIQSTSFLSVYSVLEFVLGSIQNSFMKTAYAIFFFFFFGVSQFKVYVRSGFIVIVGLKSFDGKTRRKETTRKT